MSADEITALREDIAALKAVMEERSRVAERNSALLKTIAAVVTVQLLGTVYLAGAKTKELEDLGRDVATMQSEIHPRQILPR